LPIRIEESKNAELLARLNYDVQDLHRQIEPTIFKSHSNEDMSKLFTEALKDKNVQAYVCYFDEQPVGYVLLGKRNLPETHFRYGYSVIYIEQICVKRSFKGKGIGKALIDTAKEYANKKGISRIELDFWSKNKKAGEFFSSQGFKTFNERMYILLDDCQRNGSRGN